MADGIKLPAPQKPTKVEADLQRATYEHQRKLIELGFLGRFFGNPQTSAHNVAGFTVILLLLCGTVYTFCVVGWYRNEIDKIKDFWSVISPIITLVMGYLFGKSSTPESSE